LPLFVALSEVILTPMEPLFRGELKLPPLPTDLL
jgi:hypothetical protein